MPAETRTIRTNDLEIAYEESGNLTGFPVILLHGFPDDVRTWDGVVPPLVAAGCRVLAPYLRGYGPTRFLDDSAPRMAQQAAIGKDVMDFMDALGIENVALVGYDWGGRAACIASILAPDRVRALVTINGYNVQNTVELPDPAPAAEEYAYWYQWYFNTERGRMGLEHNRREICRLLWKEWSPGWSFDDATFEQTAKSFDNPDFVDVVIHSYRHRHGNAPGDPRFHSIERMLAKRPPILVPSVVLHGAEDTVDLPYHSEEDMALFLPGTERLVTEGAGHFFPREQPMVVAQETLKLLKENS